MIGQVEHKLSIAKTKEEIKQVADDALALCNRFAAELDQFKKDSRELATARDQMDRMRMKMEAMRTEIAGLQNALSAMSLMYTRLHKIEDALMGLQGKIPGGPPATGS